MDEQKNPQQQEPQDQIVKETDFLQEKIKERPMNKKKLLRRTIITASMAVVFGLIACITFTLLEPIISSSLYPEEDAQIVTFPEEDQEVSPEDMAVDDTELEIIQEGTETAGSETQVPPDETSSVGGENVVMNENEEAAGEDDTGRLLLEEYQSIYVALGDLTEEIQKSMVTVTTVTSDTNWINDTLENTGTTSGLIVADNARELLILSDYANLEKADSIYITLCNAEQYEATIKETDKTTGLAVLAVPLESLKKSAFTAITYATLGSSLGRTAVGQPVIAVGSPNGISGSVCYGMVTSQGTALGLTDSNYKCLTTDIYGSTTSSGALVNLKGQVIGIIYHGSIHEDMENQLCAIGISELKKTIEKLSNGRSMTYLGVHGAEISAAIRSENKLPYGAYVTSIDMDSPAMQAGVQSGDIITKIGDVEILSYSEFINNLMNYNVEQNVSLTLQRQGQGSYQEIVIDITLASQP